MKDGWCGSLSETPSSLSSDEMLFEPRTETVPALSLSQRDPRHSSLMARWRDAEAARTETAWAFLPTDVGEEMESGSLVLTTDDVYWLLDVALGSDPVRAVAALGVLGAAARLDELCSRRFAHVFSEALMSSFGRVRAEAAELIWACGMVQCIAALQRAVEYEPRGHVKRTMTHALELLRGKSGDNQR